MSTVSHIMNGRSKRLPGYGYKLADDRFALDAVQANAQDVNESEMSVAFTFADGNRRDGVGDLLEVGGINCSRHRKNPVVLFDHGKQIVLPVAMAEDPRTKAYTINIDPVAKTASVKAYFYQGGNDKAHALFCEQLFDMMAKGYVRGGSIGYTVIHAREISPDHSTGTPKGLHLLSTLMLEASAVVMPANPDTVRKALSLPSVCGKPMSPVLYKSLAAYAPKPNAMVTGGWVDLSKSHEVRALYKATAKYDNITNFEAGQTVIARSYFAYVNPKTRKTEPFAATGDRLRLVSVDGPLLRVERADGESATVNSAFVRKGKGLEFTPRIKSIRAMYRSKSVPTIPTENEDDSKARLIAEILAAVFGPDDTKSLPSYTKAKPKSPQRSEGEKWQGPSGRWFTMKKVAGKTRVVMTHAPGGENGGGPPSAGKPKTPKRTPTPKPIKLSMDQAKEIVEELKRQGPTEDALNMLVASLATMTVKDLEKLKRDVGAKGGKLKADLIAKIKDTLSITKAENGATPEESADGEPQERIDGRGSEGTGTADAGDGGQVAEETRGPERQSADKVGGTARKPAGHATPRRLPAPVEEVNRKIDRFEKFFRAKNQPMVADWLNKVREHVASAGVESAIDALGGDPTASETGSDGKVQYWGVGTEEANWKNMGSFMEAYLDRNGIIAVTGDTSSPDTPLISALGAPDRYVADQDFKPSEMHFKDKLTEAKTLPGLEKSEDIEKLTGRSVTNLDADVLKKLDETYGQGQWIVKCYDDNAAAGYGIFFPQRVAAIQQDARNTIWAAGERLARYGFQLDRDPKTNKITGLVHANGDKYPFGSDKYANTIDGDARHWADRAAASADNEQGPKLPEGSFMAQPAFAAVGISDAERAAGKTWHEKNEGRVHLVTRPDGSVNVVPHSTWLKGGNLPVVFEDDDTRAMAKAAQDAISKIPLEARKGQVYAPDVMKTPDGYRVVELNAQGDNNGSGYLHDNHFTIDAYTSYLTGRQPAHVKFIRQLLTKQDRSETTKRLKRSVSVGGTRELRPRIKSLDTKSIRMTYRKSAARRLRKSVPGTTSLRVRRKELDKLRADAESAGVKAVVTGEDGDVYKVKLTGDDNAIDRVAKTYGIRY